MKIIFDYKTWGALPRTLKLYHSDDVHLTNLEPRQRKEVDIPDNIEFIYGKIDWGKTDKFKVANLPEGACVEVEPYMSMNPLKQVGISTLSIKFNVIDKG